MFELIMVYKVIHLIQLKYVVNSTGVQFTLDQNTWIGIYSSSGSNQVVECVLFMNSWNQVKSRSARI